MTTELKEAIHTDMRVLGHKLKGIRDDITQEEMAGRLRSWGLDADQRLVCLIENGAIENPADRCFTEAWLVVAGINLDDPLAQQVIEIRKFVEWVCDVERLVPHVFKMSEFLNITVALQEVCSTGKAGDIRSVRQQLRRTASNLAWDRYDSARPAANRRSAAGIWVPEFEFDWDIITYPSSVEGAVSLVLHGLGSALERIRGDLSQHELRAKLRLYGISISQQRISAIERGETSSPLQCSILEAWVRVCDYHPNDPRAQAVFEYRKLASWYCSAAVIAPRVTSVKAFRDIGISVAVLSAHGPISISEFRLQLRSAFSKLCQRHYKGEE